MVDAAKLTKNQQIVWDVIEQRIDQSPADGISAEGVFSPDVEREQRKFLDGMRVARLAAVNALRSIEGGER